MNKFYHFYLRRVDTTTLHTFTIYGRQQCNQKSHTNVVTSVGQWCAIIFQYGRCQKRAARRWACGTRGPHPGAPLPHRCWVSAFGHCVSLQVARNPVAFLFWSNVDNVARTWCTLTTRASILWISTKLMQFIAFLNLSLLQFNCCPPSLRLCNSPQVAILPRDSQMIVLSTPTQVEHWIALKCIVSIDWHILTHSRTYRNIFDRCRMILQLHTLPVSHWIWNGQEATEVVDVAISYFFQEHQSIWKSSTCNEG